MKKEKLKWKSIGHLLEARAAELNDKSLFIFDDEHLSFDEVNRRVNRVANGLKSLGVKKGDRVSVMLPNGFEYPICWFAIGKLGAVLVPTNITYKEHDLEYILSDSGASAMVVFEDYLPILEKIKDKVKGLKEIIVLGKGNSKYHSFDEITKSASDEFTITDVGEDDLINIQYTSGTTGFPKGCMLPHSYWLLIGTLTAEATNFEEGDVHLTAQPFYYVDPSWNTVLCLVVGVPLVIMHRFSPKKFWQTVNKHDVTFFYVLGTMPFYLLNLKEDPDLEQDHKLRAVICSGIYPQFHETFEKRWNVPWREAFGMVETGVDLWVPIDDADSVGSGAMGAPVRTKEAKVIDNEGNEAKDGEIGELVVRGEPMMLGYWNKPEATEEFFKDGWSHTSDLVFKDEKGYYHWVGRTKDMVRRSGENISTAEVEGVLIEHERIKMAAVVPVPDQLRGEEVKVYLILNEGETKETAPPEELVGFAKGKLAYFKIPRYIEYVDDLPRTPSERVEKHKLIKAKDDLRTDSYDAVDKVWR